MSHDTHAVNGRQPTTEAAETADGRLAELAEVQRHTVELLSRLDRQPSNVRVQAGDITLDITWDAAPAAPTAEGPVAPPAATTETTETGEPAAAADYLTSPGVGTFYHAPEPGAEPFVSVGTVVQPGQQVGIIEAMKLMIPVEADRAGRIAEVLKPNGEPVEFAEPLFALEAEDTGETEET